MRSKRPTVFKLPTCPQNICVLYFDWGGKPQLGSTTLGATLDTASITNQSIKKAKVTVGINSPILEDWSKKNIFFSMKMLFNSQLAPPGLRRNP